jgi:hypothetical protein
MTRAGFSVHIAQRDSDAYIALAERSGLTARDCLAMATILDATDGPAAALTWTERGLGIEDSYDLRAKHRQLLTVLGRHDEAIQHEWSHFTQAPTIYSYQTLLGLVPGAARATWHDRAVQAAVQSRARYRTCFRSWSIRGRPRVLPALSASAPTTT